MQHFFDMGRLFCPLIVAEDIKSRKVIDVFLRGYLCLLQFEIIILPL